VRGGWEKGGCTAGGSVFKTPGRKVPGVVLGHNVESKIAFEARKGEEL